MDSCIYDYQSLSFTLHVLEFTYLYYFTLCTIAIGQVTGVELECEPVDLINLCSVTWNVSNCLEYIIIWHVIIIL